MPFAIRNSDLPNVITPALTDTLSITQDGMTMRESIAQILSNLSNTIPSIICSPTHGGSGVSDPSINTIPIAQGKKPYKFIGPLKNGHLLIGKNNGIPDGISLKGIEGITVKIEESSIKIGTSLNIEINNLKQDMESLIKQSQSTNNNFNGAEENLQKIKTKIEFLQSNLSEKIQILDNEINNLKKTVGESIYSTVAFKELTKEMDSRNCEAIRNINSYLVAHDEKLNEVNIQFADLNSLIARSVTDNFINGLNLFYKDDRQIECSIGTAICHNEAKECFLIKLKSYRELDLSATGEFGLTPGLWKPNTRYYIFLIADSLDKSRPILMASHADKWGVKYPQGYNLNRYLGWIKTNNSGTIIPFTQKGISNTRTTWLGAPNVANSLSVPSGVEILKNGNSTQPNTLASFSMIGTSYTTSIILHYKFKHGISDDIFCISSQNLFTHEGGGGEEGQVENGVIELPIIQPIDKFRFGYNVSTEKDFLSLRIKATIEQI